MSEPDEPYEDSSDYTEYPLPGPLERSPQNTSEKPTESDFQMMFREAVSGSEFHDVLSPAGIPLRKQGSQLRVSYDQALQLLWGDDGQGM
ncbi:MAG TPA: hypothetical protein VFK47_14475 [Ktedonobacteraceae bacterium]|nr:hypothetical protein [Ktedonobacteraceae bacterium]